MPQKYDTIGTPLTPVITNNRSPIWPNIGLWSNKQLNWKRLNIFEVSESEHSSNTELLNLLCLILDMTYHYIAWCQETASDFPVLYVTKSCLHCQCCKSSEKEISSTSLPLEPEKDFLEGQMLFSKLRNWNFFSWKEVFCTLVLLWTSPVDVKNR